MITSDTIPTWFIAVTLVVTGLTWLFTRYRTIRMDSRIFAFTFIIWGIFYGLVSYYNRFINFADKIFLLKLTLVLICFSQYVPLGISWFRSVKRNDDS